MNNTIEIETEQKLKDVVQDLAHTLHNLRFYTKYWNEHGGGEARKRVKHWQDKADQLLDSLGLTLHNNITAVKVIKY